MSWKNSAVETASDLKSNVTRSKSVYAVIEQLSVEISGLEEAASALIDATDPVRAPLGGRGSDVGGTAPVPVRSPLADNLHGFLDRIVGLRERLEDAHEHLEI